MERVSLGKFMDGETRRMAQLGPKPDIYLVEKKGSWENEDRVIARNTLCRNK